MTPIVSIIIPTYNRKRYIKKAIESVFLQSHSNFEIIIVDDGSTDNTKEVLDKYLQDKRIFYYYQKNQGVSRARNNGIRKSKGEFIAILDSDDYWIDNFKLEKQINFFKENPDYVLTSGGVIRIDEQGKRISCILNPEKDEDIRKSMLFSCLFAPSGVVFKKSIWEKIGGFNESSDLSEDWEFFMEAGKNGKCYNFKDYFIGYLQGAQNRSNFNRRDNLIYNLKLIRKYKSVYPNYYKAFVVHLCYYLYSFLPFKNRLIFFFSKVKRVIFGKPAYFKET